jgi:hypothetical protein
LKFYNELNYEDKKKIRYILYKSRKDNEVKVPNFDTVFKKLESELHICLHKKKIIDEMIKPIKTAQEYTYTPKPTTQNRKYVCLMIDEQTTSGGFGNIERDNKYSARYRDLQPYYCMKNDPSIKNMQIYVNKEIKTKLDKSIINEGLNTQIKNELKTDTDTQIIEARLKYDTEKAQVAEEEAEAEAEAEEGVSSDDDLDL